MREYAKEKARQAFILWILDDSAILPLLNPRSADLCIFTKYCRPNEDMLV
jgi:hypothetical protein